MRVLLQPQVTEADVDTYGLDAGWIPLGERPAGDTVPYAFVWDVEDAGVQAEFVRDDLVQVDYLYLHGDDADGVARVAAETRARLPTWTFDEMLERLGAAGDRDVRLDSLLRLGVTRQPPTATAVAPLLATADDPDRWVRQGFVTVAGYLEWPELLERVRGLLGDPDPGVAGQARIVLGALGCA